MQQIPPPPARQGQRGSSTGQQLPQLPADQSVLVFKISRDSEARVAFSGPVTQEAIEKLRMLLDISRDTYPTQAELAQPRPAIWQNNDMNQPVTVIGDAGVGPDGRRYKKIAGSDTAIPEDEIKYSSVA